MAIRTWLLCGVLMSAAPGCFTDKGGATNSATEDSEAGSDASVSGTTPETSAATSSGPSASDASDASTGAPSTSSASTGCLDPECVAGEVAVGEACGCGHEERECSDECRWGEWACVADDAMCGVWMLPEGAANWTAMPLELNGGAQYMPDDPIQAAFDLALSDVAYVLTEKEYHQLDTSSLIWIGRGDRRDLFDEATEQNLEGAYSINLGQLNDGVAGELERVVLHSDEDVWEYEMSVDASTSFLKEEPCCAGMEDWMGGHEPVPGDMRGIWINMQGDSSWHSVSLMGCDGIVELVQLVSYGGYIVSEDSVRLRDVGVCEDFVATFLYDQYKPFTLPFGPPEPDVVGAAFHHKGTLFVIKADA